MQSPEELERRLSTPTSILFFKSFGYARYGHVSGNDNIEMRKLTAFINTYFKA